MTVSSETKKDQHDTSNSILPMSLVIIAWLGIAAFSKMAYQPPSPAKASIGNRFFSAERAEKFLRELVGDGIPHPAGSEQNKIVGDRVKTILESFGYKVQEQIAERKIGFRRQAEDSDIVPLRNLVAIKPGDKSLGSVMLACHFDSVPYGPGASDDGIAVAAILEIARMAKTELPEGREVIFLFTDGEEYGLLGADAFVSENKLAKRVEFVVNLEARGTTGPSLMFQTSEDSSQMIEIFAQSSSRPVTSSIFEEVYKRLPNDTDFTVFRENAGMRGFNFAFIGDARKYHTPEDNFENADKGSLQHHGANAWGLLKTLVSLPQHEPNLQKAVYFDLYGWKIVRWDARYSEVISGFCIAALIIGFAILIFSEQNWSKTLLWSTTTLACTFLFVLCVCALLELSFQIQERFSPPWINYPDFVSLAFWALGIFASLLGASIFNLNENACWLILWSIWSALAVATSQFVPGASYLFIVPLVFAIVTRGLFYNRSKWLANVMTSVVTAALWLPIGVLFYDAIGFSMNALLIGRICLLTWTLIPVAAHFSYKKCQQVSWISFTIGVVSLLLAIFVNQPQ